MRTSYTDFLKSIAADNWNAFVGSIPSEESPLLRLP